MLSYPRDFPRNWLHRKPSFREDLYSDARILRELQGSAPVQQRYPRNKKRVGEYASRQTVPRSNRGTLATPLASLYDILDHP